MINSWKYGGFKLSAHKYFEYQFEGKGFSKSWFEFVLTWKSKCDHAGLNFVFSLLDLFWINLTIYDHRHWDYENNCWHKY